MFMSCSNPYAEPSISVCAPISTIPSRWCARSFARTSTALYQERGVPLYWIVDLTARQVEVWTPADTEPHIEREQVLWRPAGVADRFTLSLTQLFRDV